MVTTTNYIAEIQQAKAAKEAEILNEGRDMVKELDRWERYCKKNGRGTMMLTYGEYERLREVVLIATKG